MAVSGTNYFVHTLLRARDWQHRPEFDQVCEWWRGGGRGVCALVGMGGAGKTAIADRFLDELLDITSPRRQRGNPPQSVFVYSFYDDDKPENFFRHLQTWLEGTSAPDKQKSPTQLMFDIQQNQGLIILDGLEKVQESGTRGGFGRLTSPSLRDLLNHIACGSARDVSVLVTSRFPLTDLRDNDPRYFHTIPIDQIDVPTGIALLRARGVHGTDMQLGPIVEHCGRHALTVDLAGGYIKEYGHGDPTTPLNLGTAEELQAEAEHEPDDDKRAVLKQGTRFARIAQRYREAMLASDEAALALLERICLFRLGVGREPLAAVFTGSDAENVSGKALAGLNPDQLQQKLDWLVKMRIVEESEPPSSSLQSHPSSLYTIHPAVRDGFLSGISREAAQASHEAILQAMEVSLGDAPGKNPSDPATLDLLEEILHHTLESGHVSVALGIVYRVRIGDYENLARRLGAYERGERILRAFVGGEQPESLGHLSVEGEGQDDARKPPFLHLSEDGQAFFINEWALYLGQLGLLAAAARCFGLLIDMHSQSKELKEVAARNLCEVWLRSGRLAGSGGAACPSVQHASGAAAEAVRLARLSDDETERSNSHALRAQTHALRGEVQAALDDFRAAVCWQNDVDEDEYEEEYEDDFPLNSLSGIQHTLLLARLGRYERAARLTEANKRNVTLVFGADNSDIPKCNLVLADLAGESLDWSTRESLCQSARHWAMERNAKEVLCWSALVQARIELARAILERTRANRENREDKHSVSSVSSCSHHVADGLKIARDCGYGIFHIDLLLERARLYLLRGDPQSALDDLRLALDDGIPANKETGQVELLAANHEECGYAWAIPPGLQLRAEAQLLQAAQVIGEAKYKPRSRKTPDEARELIKQAKSNLQKAMRRWKKLRDPEPTEDNNFKHPKTGEEYNYRAAETFQVITDLADGLLTRHPLTSIVLAVPDAESEPPSQDSPGTDGPTASDTTVPVEPSRPAVSHIVELVAVLVEALPKQVPFVDLVSVASLPGFPTGVSAGRYPKEIHDLDDALRTLDPKGPNLTYGKASHLAKREVRLSGWPDEVRTSLMWLGNLVDEVLLRITATPPQPLKRELLEAFNEAAELLTSASSTQEDDDDVESQDTQRPPRAARTKEQLMSFDVFLSHNSKDKPDVRRLGETLKKRGITVWLDEWELRPGLSWQDALEEIITNCKSAAVCVGDNGIGPWEDPEMKALLRRFVNEKKTGNIVPIIPVLLPGAPDDVKLPLFLGEFTWVDLRDGLKKDGLDRLEWGITGVKPNP